MYDDKKIKKIVKKVCEQANVTTNIHPNGERAEGYSFIVTGMLYSWVIDALIKAMDSWLQTGLISTTSSHVSM